jgi:hypothetical protein
MTAPESSSTRVPYDLRPRKQVERRMMAHVFQLLAEAGFPISTYRYVGFGAFFFVDFILFRRLLGTTDMISIEHDLGNERRVRFNRPFKDIGILFQTSSEYISQMSRDKPHILWLDYDDPIARDQLADLQNAASTLCLGSALIATFDVDFDKARDLRIRTSTMKDRPKAWFDRFQDQCGDLFNPTWKIRDFVAGAVPKRVTEVAEGAIRLGLSMRNEVTFEPLFNFCYADGHEMLTIGGLVCSKPERRTLRRVEWEEVPFTRRSLSSPPFRIDVPVLTRKERLYIDSHMPCELDWSPEEFELEPTSVLNYRQIYRYCPLYAELLL